MSERVGGAFEGLGLRKGQRTSHGEAVLGGWSQYQSCAGPLILLPLVPRLKFSRPSRSCSEWHVRSHHL